MHVFVSAATEALDDEDLSAIRRRRIGFVFQFHFPLPEFTIVDDVPIPMRRLGDGDAGAMRGRDEREPWKISSSTDRAGKALRFAWYVKRRKRVSSARWHHSWVPPFEARAAQDEGKGHPPAPG